MAFGFDPSIILASRTADPIGTARSLGDLLAQRQQMSLAQNQDARAQAMNQATLAGMLQNQRFGAESHAQDMAMGKAKLQSALIEGRRQMGELLYGTKDQADYENRLSMMPDELRSQFPAQFEQVKPTLDAFAFTPQEQKTFAEKQAALQETSRHNKAEEANQREGINKSRFKPDAFGRVIDTWTGQVAGGIPGAGGTPAPGGSGGTTPGPTGPPLKEADWQKFIRALDSAGGKTGELGKNQSRIGTAMRLEKLYTDPETGGIRNLDKREIPELAMGLQNLLSPGGHSTAEVEHLIPETFQGDIQGYLEKLTNTPQGVGMQAFVQKMAHTVQREKEASQQANDMLRYEVIPGFGAKYATSDPARFQSILRGHHLDPSALDENYVYKGSSGPKADSAAHDAAAKWLADPANKNSPNYAAVKAAYDKANGK